MEPVTTSALIAASASAAKSVFSGISTKRRREEQYEREDTAVQRRANDMEMAGLSKTLAAGSPAQTSSQPTPDYSGFSDAAKHIGNIPMAKANKAAVEAQANKAQAETEAIQYQNFERANRQQWLETGSDSAPTWPAGTTSAGMPMWTNKEEQRQLWSREQEQSQITNGFYNQYGLPNQPGVLQSQTGQILMLNRAWANMNDLERRDFLLAYGAKTLGDVASNLLGSAAGSLGRSAGTPAKKIPLRSK